jgi:hypothetical protein
MCSVETSPSWLYGQHHPPTIGPRHSLEFSPAQQTQVNAPSLYAGHTLKRRSCSLFRYAEHRAQPSSGGPRTHLQVEGPCLRMRSSMESETRAKYLVS